MKKNIWIFFLVLFFFSCSKNSDYEEITGNISPDINRLLPEGLIGVEILEARETPRQKELSDKLEKAVKANLPWFYEYKKKATPGQALPYHPNFGLTEDEFDELNNIVKKSKWEVVAKERLKIIKEDTLIKFRSVSGLMFLETIRINPHKNLVYFQNQKLDFKDTILVEDPENKLGSEWKGYKWEYTYPTNLNTTTPVQGQKIDTKNYTFTLGKLKKTKKSFLNMTVFETMQGRKAVDLNILITF